MHSHSKVQDDDLAKLEQKIRHGINSANTYQGYDSKRVAHEGGAIRPGTGLSISRGVSTPNRTRVCSVGTPAKGSSPRNMQASRSLAGSNETHESRPRPRTAGCATFHSGVQGHAGAQMQSAAGRQSSDPDNLITVPSSIKNEWLILETYHQLMSEDKHAEEQNKVQRGETPKLNVIIRTSVVVRGFNNNLKTHCRTYALPSFQQQLCDTISKGWRNKCGKTWPRPSVKSAS